MSRLTPSKVSTHRRELPVSSVLPVLFFDFCMPAYLLNVMVAKPDVGSVPIILFTNADTALYFGRIEPHGFKIATFLKSYSVSFMTSGDEK